MGIVRDSHDLWETAKSVLLTYVLAFAAGWLTSEMHDGKISEHNRVAAVILLITVGTTLAVFSIVGVRRWRAGKLSAMEKRIMVFSIVMIAVCFVAGWRAEIPAS